MTMATATSAAATATTAVSHGLDVAAVKATRDQPLVAMASASSSTPGSPCAFKLHVASVRRVFD